jgi:uncharacterized protein (DUF2237 family)
MDTNRKDRTRNVIGVSGKKSCGARLIGFFEDVSSAEGQQFVSVHSVANQA